MLQHIAELITFNVLQNAGAVLQPQIPVHPEEELEEVLPDDPPLLLEEDPLDEEELDPPDEELEEVAQMTV